MFVLSCNRDREIEFTSDGWKSQIYDRADYKENIISEKMFLGFDSERLVDSLGEPFYKSNTLYRYSFPQKKFNLGVDVETMTVVFRKNKVVEIY